MRIFYIIFLVILFFLFLPVEEICAQPEEGLVFVAEVDGEIKAGTLQYVKRAVEKAKAGRAELFVIKLDTLGGLLKPTQDIADLLLQTEMKTAVFVNKESGRAFSAGTFILLAADFAFVNPTASIGAAQPLEMFSQNEASDKIVSATASWIRGLAEARSRDPQIAEKFVRENLSLTGKEAEELGIIDGAVSNLDELLLKLGIVNPEIKEIKPTFFEVFFDFLSHPYLVSLFLTLGSLALILAFRTGEFETSGLIGFIFLLTGLWGIGVITFNVLGIIFLALGIFLLFLEILSPGFGFFGFLGIASLIFGIFTLEREPFFQTKFFDAVTMLVLGALAGILILFIIICRGAFKTFKTKPKTGAESLVGLEAEVLEELKPAGRVRLKQESWRAESMDGKTIDINKKVKVIKIEGNTLFVEKLEN